MNDLSYLCPVPEPVTLGGESYQAVCFQLRDLARLQMVVKNLSGNPLDGQRYTLLVAKQVAGGDYWGDSEASRGYANRLRESIRNLDGWPPLVTSLQGDRLLLGTEAGRVLWLTVLLERTNPGFTAIDAHRVQLKMTGEEWLAIQAIAYVDFPADWLSRLMDAPPRRPGLRKTWGEFWEWLATSRGWTYPQIAELYLSQVEVIAAEGRITPGAIAKSRANAFWYQGVMARRRGLMEGNGLAESH